MLDHTSAFPSNRAAYDLRRIRCQIPEQLRAQRFLEQSVRPTTDRCALTNPTQRTRKPMTL